MKTRTTLISVGVLLAVTALAVCGQFLLESKAQSAPAPQNTRFLGPEPEPQSVENLEAITDRRRTSVYVPTDYMANRKPASPELELHLAHRQRILDGLQDAHVNAAQEQLRRTNARRAESGLPALEAFGPNNRPEAPPGAPPRPGELSPEQAQRVREYMNAYHAEAANLLYMMKDATPERRKVLTQALNELSGMFIQEAIIQDLPQAPPGK